MKRLDLMSAISELKDSDNIQESIEALESVAKDFIDHCENKFESIEQCLDGIDVHNGKAKEARNIADKCASDLF